MEATPLQAVVFIASATLAVGGGTVIVATFLGSLLGWLD